MKGWKSKQNKKKGIALSLKIVAEVLIAIVAAFIILSIFQSFLPGIGNPALCRIYRVILALPIPSSMKPNIAECSIQPTTERFIISESDKAKIIDTLVAKTMNCWKEKANDGKIGITFICYEIFLKKIDGEITEKDFTIKLQQEGHCSILPNNFLDSERMPFSCGNLNKVFWQAMTINGTDITIIIKFNAFQKRIEII